MAHRRSRSTSARSSAASPDVSRLMVGLFWMARTSRAKRSVATVSGACAAAGLTHATISALELPPSES